MRSIFTCILPLALATYRLTWRVFRQQHWRNSCRCQKSAAEQAWSRYHHSIPTPLYCCHHHSITIIATPIASRHDNEIRTHGYPSEPVPTLTRNTRIDQIRVRTRGLPNFLIRVGIGVGDRDVTTYPVPVLIPTPMMKLLKIYLLIVNFILEFLYNLIFFS